MKANIKSLIKKVNNASINKMIAHLKSPLKSGGKKPKNNTVQENPTGASLIAPVFGFCIIIDVNAMPNLQVSNNPYISAFKDRNSRINFLCNRFIIYLSMP